MIQSMTGFATASVPFKGGSLQMELKGVNARFLDLFFKVADDLRVHEPSVRQALTTQLARGKVECRLQYTRDSATAGPEGAVNSNLLAQLADWQAAIQAALPTARPLSTGEVLRWPGILGDVSLDFEALGPEVMVLTTQALESFVASRAREGKKLAEVIHDRVRALREGVSQIEPMIPEAQAAHAEKLRQRLREALGSADEDRINQEIAIYATRIDVAEEFARLRTHLDEVERVLAEGGQVGKRLDFLMQELNREANTLGSKSVLSAVSQAAMEFKLLIEQMREQVQNLA